MPEEIFVLSLFSILAGTGLLILIVSHIASYFKRRQQGAGGDNALRTSELEAMLRKIVREEVRDAIGSESQFADHSQVLLDEHLDAYVDGQTDDESRPRVTSGRSAGRTPRIR